MNIQLFKRSRARAKGNLIGQGPQFAGICTSYPGMPEKEAFSFTLESPDEAKPNEYYELRLNRSDAINLTGDLLTALLTSSVEHVGHAQRYEEARNKVREALKGLGL